MSNNVEDYKNIDIEKTINFFEETKDYDGLISFCKKILKDCNDDKICGDSARIDLIKLALMSKIALTYADKEDYDTALKYANQILEIDVEYLLAYRVLGTIYEKKGLKGLSEEYRYLAGFLKHCEAKKTYKNFFHVSIFFLQLFTLTKNDLFYLAAVKNFNKAIEYKPKSADAYYFLSYLHSESKNYKEAIKTLVKALAIKPKNKDYIYQLGNLYFNSEKYKLAIKMFEKYLKLHKKSNKYIDYILSKSYFMGNNHATAIKLINKTIKTDPESADFYELLGDLYFKLEKYEDAIENFKIAVSIEPLSGLKLAKLGKIYYFNKMLKEALIIYEKINEIEPNDKTKKLISNIKYELYNN